MKLSGIILALVLCGSLFVTALSADDLSDIIALEHGHYAARNRGDVDTWVQYHSPARNGFGPGGGLLGEGVPLDEEKASLQAQLDAGTKYNHQVKHLEVQIFGEAALTTSYIVGTLTSPDGTVRRANMRRTGVLVKKNGKWLEVHNHLSPLVLSQ